MKFFYFISYFRQILLDFGAIFSFPTGDFPVG